MLRPCAIATDGMTTSSDGLTNTAMITGATWLRIIENIWNKFAVRKRSRLSSAPIADPDTSAIGKRQAIHGSAPSTSGFKASGMESTC